MAALDGALARASGPARRAARTRELADPACASWTWAGVSAPHIAEQVDDRRERIAAGERDRLAGDVADDADERILVQRRRHLGQRPRQRDVLPVVIRPR